MAKKMIEKTAALKVIEQEINNWREEKKATGSDVYRRECAARIQSLVVVKGWIAALGLLALLLLAGCSSLRQLGASLRPGVSLTDQRFAGVAGAFVSPTAALADLRAGTGAGLVVGVATGGVANDPLGFLLPITLPGQTLPAVYAICSPGKWATRCAEVATVNQPIVAYGQQVPGLPFLVLSRLVKE